MGDGILLVRQIIVELCTRCFPLLCTRCLLVRKLYAPPQDESASGIFSPYLFETPTLVAYTLFPALKIYQKFRMLSRPQRGCQIYASPAEARTFESQLLRELEVAREGKKITAAGDILEQFAKEQEWQRLGRVARWKQTFADKGAGRVLLNH